MDKRYLIDTSAVIKYLNGTFPLIALEFMDKVIDDICIISFISEVELKVWNPGNLQDEQFYMLFVENSEIISISQSIIDLTIEVRKNYKIKLPDAFIAGTAIANNLTLIADNDKDFSKIRELTYINPRFL